MGTWTSDALLSIRARAEVGSDAQTAAAAEGAERCGEGGQTAVRREGGPPQTHPSLHPQNLYSRRVHCPLPGDSIHPGQHPLPKPEKQTWGPTRRLRDRREDEATLPRAPRTEEQRSRGCSPQPAGTPLPPASPGHGDTQERSRRAHGHPIPGGGARHGSRGRQTGTGRTGVQCDPKTRWDRGRGSPPSSPEHPGTRW